MVNKTKNISLITIVQYEIVRNLGYNTVINQSKCCTDKPTILFGLTGFKITTA